MQKLPKTLDQVMDALARMSQSDFDHEISELARDAAQEDASYRSVDVDDDLIDAHVESYEEGFRDWCKHNLTEEHIRESADNELWEQDRVTLSQIDMAHSNVQYEDADYILIERLEDAIFEARNDRDALVNAYQDLHDYLKGQE